MAKQGKLSPIQKMYTQSFRTFESSLAAHGFYRAPGTVRSFTPFREANGGYRTGLNPNAKYILAMTEENRAAELERIESAVEQLKKGFGANIDLSPTSKVWNVYSDSMVKATPVKIGNSVEFFDLTTPQGLLNYSWVRVHPQIASSYEAWKRGEYPDAQYYLADEEVETKMVYNRKKEINQAIVKFESLVATEKKQIARLMGLPINDDISEEQVYNDIDTLLKQSEFTEGQHKGLSTIRIFTDLIALDKGRLKVKDIVEQAIRHSIYREGVGGKIVEGVNTIATTKDDLVTYLLEDEHQMDLLALSKRLEVKKTANVL